MLHAGRHLHRGMRGVNRRLAADVLKVIGVLPLVEWRRRRSGPLPTATSLRARGAGAPARNSDGRALLKKAIRFVDARLPGGPNCYRRALLEIALDAGAAREPLHFGLIAHGGPRSGHAWLGDPATAEDAASYDARFVI